MYLNDIRCDHTCDRIKRIRCFLRKNVWSQLAMRSDKRVRGMTCKRECFFDTVATHVSEALQPVMRVNAYFVVDREPRLCSDWNAEVNAFCSRPKDAKPYPRHEVLYCISFALQLVIILILKFWKILFQQRFSNRIRAWKRHSVNWC